MGTNRRRNWFFNSYPWTTETKFRQNNRPVEDTFRDFLGSVLFRTEPDDSAKETSAGHVRLTTDTEAIAGTDSTVNMAFKGSWSKVIKPSQLPWVGTLEANTHSISGILAEEYGGLSVQKVRWNIEGGDRNVIKYLLKLLYDSDWFEINADEELTIKEEIATALLELIEDKDDIIKENDLDQNLEIRSGNGIGFTSSKFFVDIVTSMFEFVDGKLSLKDSGITLSKLQNIPSGSVIVGNIGGGVPVLMSLLGEGNILIGTSVGAEIVNINDLIGSISIDDDSILARKVASSTLGNGLERDSAASDSSKIHVALSDTSSLSFNNQKIELLNDEEIPSDEKFYGIRGGVKGWYYPVSEIDFAISLDDISYPYNQAQLTLSVSPSGGEVSGVYTYLWSLVSDNGSGYSGEIVLSGTATNELTIDDSGALKDRNILLQCKVTDDRGKTEVRQFLATYASSILM